MNKTSKLGQLTNFVFYTTLQLAFARFIVFFHTAFCFVYVTFLLLLPRREGGLPLQQCGYPCIFFCAYGL
jgi:hypothetical protein